MTVRDWMTANPQTISPRDMLALAQDKMIRGRYRRLPVLDVSGALIGMLAQGDLRPFAGYLPTTRVDAAMVEQPFTIGPDEPVEAAAKLMLERKVGGLPVTDDAGKLMGIITESDLLRVLLRPRSQ
ncbi:MAG: CBS domain-containing protein [Deltaproteobacteria bacterium]|nr:CBS domain-containing protein [Deltaproteobacteria bacterium]MBI3386961.1 CBS domain-containing protein [Deltaproteobacteria bacterium]